MSLLPNLSPGLSPPGLSTPSHFTQHAFTSTIDHKNHHNLSFNLYPVLMTALFFFAVLSWFNFVLAWYETLTSTDSNHKDQTISSLGFALIWTGVVVAIYFVMNYYGVLNSITESEYEHPLLKGERTISDTGDYTGSVGRIGSIDFSAI